MTGIVVQELPAKISCYACNGRGLAVSNVNRHRRCKQCEGSGDAAIAFRHVMRETGYDEASITEIDYVIAIYCKVRHGDTDLSGRIEEVLKHCAHDSAATVMELGDVPQLWAWLCEAEKLHCAGIYADDSWSV